MWLSILFELSILKAECIKAAARILLLVFAESPVWDLSIISSKWFERLAYF
jgi:hypothetical protein